MLNCELISACKWLAVHLYSVHVVALFKCEWFPVAKDLIHCLCYTYMYMYMYYSHSHVPCILKCTCMYTCTCTYNVFYCMQMRSVAAIISMYMYIVHSLNAQCLVRLEEYSLLSPVNQYSVLIHVFVFLDPHYPPTTYTCIVTLVVVAYVTVW